MSPWRCSGFTESPGKDGPGREAPGLVLGAAASCLLLLECPRHRLSPGAPQNLCRPLEKADGKESFLPCFRPPSFPSETSINVTPTSRLASSSELGPVLGGCPQGKGGLPFSTSWSPRQAVARSRRTLRDCRKGTANRSCTSPGGVASHRGHTELMFLKLRPSNGFSSFGRGTQ